MAEEQQENMEAPDAGVAVAEEAAPAEMDGMPAGANAMSIKKIQNIKVHVQAVLGGISLSVSELASLKQGEFIPLDTKIGDPIDILANGHLIAKGEIVVLEEDKPRFGITLTEIIDTGSAPI